MEPVGWNLPRSLNNRPIAVMPNGDRTGHTSDGAQIELRPPPPLKILSEGMDKNWNLWKQNYEWYAIAAQLERENPAIQVATFMNIIGQEAAAIFNTFVLSKNEKFDLNVIKARFDEQFAPKRNEACASWTFQTLRQGEQEPFDEFLTKARTLIRKCEYGDLENRMLRDKIISGVNSDAVREKLLAEPMLDLTRAVLICRNHEIARKQVQEMKGEDERKKQKKKEKKERKKTKKENKEKKTKSICR